MIEFDGPGLYIHVPFCRRICPYCDFSVLTGDRSWQNRYLQHLAIEIDLLTRSGWPASLPAPPQRPFDTIYFGGGTPSVLTPLDLASILDRIREKLPVHDDAWLYLEVNPEDVSRETAAAWRQLGFRTISLGVQSFSDSNLSFLGRRHSAVEARRSVDSILAAGFHTVAMDLIYGLPGQETEAWSRDLDIALSIGLHHLSCYQLTVHPQTPFGFRRQRGELVELAGDQQADLFLLTHRRLRDEGLPGYEVSNFAAGEEHRSLHNQKYWRHSPYLGLGPSAHSHAGGRRWWNARKIKPWMAPLAEGRLPIEGHEELGLQNLVLERLMLGLRTYDGVDFDTLPGELGARLWKENEATIADLVDGGWTRVVGSRLRPTLHGLLMADTLARSFDLSSLER